jgi:starvation-inducible DNA-binding protein
MVTLVAKTDKKTGCYIALVQALRDTSYLLNQTYIVHWNLIGCKFYSIHKLTESMYEELQDGLDAIAEHLRSLDIAAPKTVEDLNYSTLPAVPDDCFDQEGLISTLAANSDLLADKFAEIAKQAGAVGDDLTLDLAVERARAHKKFQWLLKSNLGC